MKNILFLILAGLFTAPAFSQNPDSLITGLVTNEADELLIGASLRWADGHGGAITNGEGRFFIPARDTLSVLLIQYVGYSDQQVTIVPGENNLWIVLSENTQLETVTVQEHTFDNAVSTLDPRNIESIHGKELRKAPCCNLSESFQTNGSVDVAYSNALTGVKEIQLLGLRGVYSQFMVENRPTMGGIATPFGFEYIPGTWLSSIQLAKGASTVRNGFAGITGQINAELVKPHIDEPIFVNAFTSTEGRGELNLHLNQKGKGKFHQGLLLHGNVVQNRWDMNNDNFYDMPSRRQLNGMYRAFYESDGLCGQVNVHALTDQRVNGQIRGFENQELFRIEQNNERVEVWAKAGQEGVWGRPYREIGNIISGSWHRTDAFYGRNQYNATQHSLYWQSLYKTIIGTTDHSIVIAPSIQYDDIAEQVNNFNLGRREFVPGAMAEYTFSRPHLGMEIPDLVIVAGARLDWNSRFGWLFTPRASVKYNFTENTVVRASAGRGYRSPNLVAENISLLASNRTLEFAPDLGLEEAWNYGVNFSHTFKVGSRNASINVDVYRTDFASQVIADVEHDVTKVMFYHTEGPSYANNAMVMLQYSPLNGLDVKTGYKWNDTRATYRHRGLLDVPLLARHRGLIAVDYETPGKKWMMNTHIQIVGPQRLPDNSQLPHEFHHLHERTTSPAYALLNGQVTYRFTKDFEIYAGGENFTGFMQHEAIISANDPWSPYFNAAQLWGPTMGTVGYLGIRWNVR